MESVAKAEAAREPAREQQQLRPEPGRRWRPGRWHYHQPFCARPAFLACRGLRSAHGGRPLLELPSSEAADPLPAPAPDCLDCCSQHRQTLPVVDAVQVQLADPWPPVPALLQACQIKLRLVHHHSPPAWGAFSVWWEECRHCQVEEVAATDSLSRLSRHQTSSSLHPSCHRLGRSPATTLASTWTR